jgi:hypothetical protein
VDSLDRIKLSYYLDGHTSLKPTEIEKRECRYFLKGKCNKGNKCKFYHPKKNGQIVITADKENKGNTVQ